MRAKLGVGEAPLVLYPGDYEVSHGAATVARAVAAIVRKVPDARVVFACRAKTPRSAIARAAVENDLRAAGLLDHTRHAGEVDDMAALLAASSVVAFPVDDLYGKVDLPLVLLEALALGVPLLLARDGPLESITSARFVSPRDPADLAASLTEMLTGDPGRAATIAAQGLELYTARFTPRVVAAQYDDLYEEMLVSALPGTP
jgi:phosphatidylinositol alpha-1,6-mannosyltransferase